MSKYEKLPTDHFKHKTFGAGVLVSDFSPSDGALSQESILWATTGGTTFNATRDLVDAGASTDNCPEGAKQLQRAKPYQATLSGTAKDLTPATVVAMLGNADTSNVSSGLDKITPRNHLKLSDFKDIWLIANYSDDNTEENGGFVAIHLMNTLSMDGFSEQNTKDEDGKFPFQFKAFYDLDHMDQVPFEIYIKTGGAA